MVAAYNDYSEVVTLFIDRGVKINAQNKVAKRSYIYIGFNVYERHCY